MGTIVRADAIAALCDRIATRDGRASATVMADGAGIALTYRDDAGCDRLVVELVPRDGALTLNVPHGDLRICAQEGAVEIAAKTDVRMTAATAECRVGVWRLAASRIRERAESIILEADETLHMRAKKMRAVSQGMFQVLSRWTSLRSKDNTSIDGKRILLG